MFPPKFEYEHPQSIEDALSLMGNHAANDTEVELLAGGHSLLPTMKSGLASPDVLIDIGDIEELLVFEVNDEMIRIGAMTPYVDVYESPAVWDGATVFADAVHHIGDVQIRNRGTVGGNIAHADPASDLPGALLASDGAVVAQGSNGERKIPADDFFMGMYATALESDEILSRIELPVLSANHVGAYAKKPSPSSGYPIVGVAAVIEADKNVINSARVAANGIMDHGVRLLPVEEALVSESLDSDTIETAGEQATSELDEIMMMEDHQASSPYRAQLTREYTKEALRKAFNRVEPTASADG